MWKFSLQKTIFVQIFLKFEKHESCLYKRRLSFKIFWNLKKHLKRLVCKFFWNHTWKLSLQKMTFIHIFLKFEKRENYLYKKRLSFKFFWNLKKHLKDDFLKKEIRSRVSQRWLSQEKSSLRNTILNQSIQINIKRVMLGLKKKKNYK